MTNPTGFTFGTQSSTNGSSNDVFPATPNGPQNIFFGGTRGDILSLSGGPTPPSTPAVVPPLYPGLFSKGSPITTGSGAFNLPMSSYTTPGAQFMGSPGFPKADNVGTTQPTSNDSFFPAAGPPGSFTFDIAFLKPQGFGGTQMKGIGVVAGPVPSTLESIPIGPSTAGPVSLTPTLLNSSNTLTSSTGDMFNAVFNKKNATSTGGLFGAPSATNPTPIFTAPQTTSGSNGSSIFAATGNTAPAASPMTPIFGPPGQFVFTPVEAQPSPSIIGNQLAQLASIAASRPAISIFGVPTVQTASQVATGSTAQIFSHPTASGHPAGPNIFSPSPITGVFSTATPMAPPIGSLFKPAQAQPSAPHTSIFGPPSSAPPGIPLFSSATIPPIPVFESTTPPVSPTFPAATPTFTPATPAQFDVMSTDPDTKSYFPQVLPQHRLNNDTSLEEIVNRWSSDLETYKADFTQRGLEINKCDTILVEHFRKVDDLDVEVTEAEMKGSTINRRLDQLVGEQEHMERLLDYYEASLYDIEKECLENQPVDEEREIVFQAVLVLNDKLLAAGSEVGDMIKALNNASAKVENTTNIENPLSPIVKILNDHLSVMQWVDAQTTSLDVKIRDRRLKAIARPRDTEGDETMRHFHNEYRNALGML